jgi:hypothetical protein
MKKITAAKLKAQCSRVVDDVQVTREPVVITKVGRLLRSFQLTLSLCGASDTLGTEAQASALRGIWDVPRRCTTPLSLEIVRTQNRLERLQGRAGQPLPPQIDVKIA